MATLATNIMTLHNYYVMTWKISIDVTPISLKLYIYKKAAWEISPQIHLHVPGNCIPKRKKKKRKEKG